MSAASQDDTASLPAALPRSVSRFVWGAFFVSGACALVYEVVWLKMLSLIFGVTTVATATVLASFMAGLGLGTFFLGRLADRITRPLRVYAFLEFGIAAFAILMPVILSGVDRVDDLIYHNLTTSYVVASVVRFCLSFAVLLLPTFLMGGTLPMITAFVVGRNGGFGATVGRLYFFNTLGAVGGAGFAGFIGLYVLGVRESGYVAGVLNAVVGLGALLVERRHGGSFVGAVATDRSAPSSDIVRTGVSPRLVLGTAMISGFCSLAYQVLWNRSLVFILDNTIHAFTTLLMTFLLGIALGSLVMSRAGSSLRSSCAVLGFIQIGIGVCGLVSIPILFEFGAGIGAVTGDAIYPTASQSEWALIRFLRSLVVMFVPTMLMGMALPLATRLYSMTDVSPAWAVGKVFSLNTLGAVVGSGIAGLLLIPLLGVHGGVVFVAGLNLAIGFALIINEPLRESWKRWQSLVAGLAVTGLAVAAAPPWKPIVFSSAVEGLNPQRTLFYREGNAATVKVFSELAADGDGKFTSLSIDGFPVAGTLPSHVDGQKSLGHFPFLLTRKDSPRVGIVGHGAGGSAWASTLYPTSRVDVIELVPDVIAAARLIPEVNHGAMDDSRVQIVHGDGRNYLRRTRQTYDILSVDATSPKSAGSGALYSVEFYRSVAERLAPDGLMVQWLPFHLMTEADTRMIARSFQAVFPEATLWYSFSRHYYILVGTREKLRLDLGRLESHLSRPEIRADLEDQGVRDAYDFLACFLMSAEGLRRYAGEGPTNSDNRPFLEYEPTTIYLDSEAQVRSNLNASRPLREKATRFVEIGAQSAELVRQRIEDRVEATPIEGYWPQYIH